MAINEPSSSVQVVDFSVPYFDANQGLITKGGPAEGVTSIDMKDLQFGFQAATTGGDYINDKIQPDKQPRDSRRSALRCRRSPTVRSTPS